jgi:hypothetical protein
MAEADIKLEEKEAPNTEEGNQDEPQYSEIEQKAMSLGWKPQDDYEGEADWVSPEIWIARTPLFEKIDHLKKRNQSIEKRFNDLTTHYNKVQITEYNRAIKDLQAKKLEAIRDENLDAAASYEQQIDDLRDNVPKPIAQDENPANQEAEEWRAANSWYDKDIDLQKYADVLIRGKAAAGEPLSNILEDVEREVKLRYPEKFINPNRRAANRVENGGGKKGTGARDDSKGFKLTDEETRVMKTLVDAGVLTREKYIEDIKKTREAL